MSIKNVISKNGVWKTAPLNDSSSSGVPLVVHDVDGTLDKTWQEIHDAMLVGSVVVSLSETDISAMFSTRYNSIAGVYDIAASDAFYTASSADGYPTLSE